MSQARPTNPRSWIRPFHRWLSIAFTLAVIANLIAVARKEQAAWVGLLALLPLVLLMLTGLYMFMSPYLSRRGGRGGRP